jgi:hypothetical protein
MKLTIVLTTILVACVNIGRAANTQMTTSIHQTTAHHICQSQSRTSLVFKGEERNTIDTTGEDERALPKSKPKKHVFAKVVLGLTATFVIVFILVASSGNFMRMM